MEETIFARNRMLFGEDGLAALQKAHVAVFGIGGVGGNAAEALVRAGIGEITVVDSDTVSVTNRNRQIIALASTVGKRKTDVMEARLLDVNPNLIFHGYPLFFTEENAAQMDFSEFDYVLDCIDTVGSKLLLLKICKERKIPLLACMGTGNKTDPTRLKISDIAKTSVCPLAKVMRIECRKRGYTDYRVLWSDEIPLTPVAGTEEPAEGRRAIPASTPFVPPAAGILLARTAVMELLSRKS